MSSGRVLRSRTVEICRNVEMPLMGLGTFRMVGCSVIHTAIDAAISAGYRMIDTAQFYENEADIGKSLQVLTGFKNIL